MGIPICFFGKGLVDNIVEVFIVREDDMATNVIELWRMSATTEEPFCALLNKNGPTKPSGVVSVEARPPGVELESIIIHEGPSCRGQRCDPTM